MNKKRIQIIVVVVLLLVFIFVLINVIKKKSIPKVSPASAIFEEAVSLLSKKEGQDIDKNLGWLRDPFSGKIYSGIETELKLMGIIWDETEPLAMINDSIVKRGGRVGTNRVIQIKKDRVILNDGTSNFELKLQ